MINTENGFEIRCERISSGFEICFTYSLSEGKDSESKRS